MKTIVPEKFENGLTKLPSWFNQPVPDMDKIKSMKAMFRTSGLHTVCESANCPNMGTCWKAGVATFMILGGTCTRACRFCSVPAGRPDTLDPHEPKEVALNVLKMKLRYVVITSVARDDLDDDGATHFAQTIDAIRRVSPETKIEVLIPDFSAKEEALKILSDAAPEVISHNVETVRRLSPSVRSKALHDRSLHVLKRFSALNPTSFVKTSFMVGLGESEDEVIGLMKEVLDSGCQILTIGQYLAPTQMKRHIPVDRFVTPEEFERFRQSGMELGFKYVESGPLVRSSYIAEKGYREALAR
ncbi:MAG: lipoyl synthase [Candidatus Omnitrophica bacterium]|nr:lipoyl synthase [Candidatus Omnitrophota bacterium]